MYTFYRTVEANINITCHNVVKILPNLSYMNSRLDQVVHFSEIVCFYFLFLEYYACFVECVKLKTKKI